MSAETPVPAEESEGPASPVIALLTRLPARWVALALLVVIVAVIGAVVLLVRGGGDEDQATPTPSLSPLTVDECETIISSQYVQVAVSLPITLSLGGELMPILPVALGEEGWSYPAEYSGNAAWVCGTVVNYVVGLESTTDNESLLDALSAGDLIELTLANGAGFLFRYDDYREELDADDPSIFEQSQPGITLVLETEGGLLRVLRADYETSAEPLAPIEAGDSVGPETAVRVGDVRVTVLSGRELRGVAGLLPGTMYYVVELHVENLGQTPVETGLFNMLLQDSAGSSYLLSPPASIAGDSGPFEGAIAAGSSEEGTAGYLVPETLQGPELLWMFSPRPNSSEAAWFRIPYEPEPAAPGSVAVMISDAFLSSGGDQLVIVGEIRNTTSSSLTVLATDVRLSSSAGMGNLRMAAPLLPWTVAAGQTKVIELQYDTPAATSALLSILGFSFEIGGLPGLGGYGGGN
jgi:hypothetical protein